MKRLLLVLLIAIGLIAVACGSEGVDKESVEGAGSGFETGEGLPAPLPGVTPLPAPTPTPAPAPAPAMAPPLEGSASSTVSLQTAERQVISSASMTVKVQDVQGATTQVRAIAESLGGFVEQLSSSGAEKSQQATVTIRVPQEQFFAAVERLKALGESLSESLGSEDVTERFIDLEARLKSALREEQSLLSLLEKTTSVTEILTIERELSRVRSQIEQLQGQLNFLERRVALATITIFLVPPEVKVSQPPSASLTVEASRVPNSVEQIKALVANMGGEIDNVFLSVRDGTDRAEIGFRVFAKDFAQALAGVEDQGKVKTKQVQEGLRVEGAEAPEDPDAPIAVSLTEKVKAGNAGLIAAIVAPIGGVALAGLLAVSFWLAYRWGRRRGSRS